MNKIKPFFALCISVLLAAGCQTTEQEISILDQTPEIVPVAPSKKPSMERTELLPVDTQMHVRLSDTTVLGEKLKLSSIGKLYADPLFKSFIGDPDADVWYELLFEGESEAEDEVFKEQLKMLNGELILAVTAEEEQPYIIAAISEEKYLHSLELDEQLQKVMAQPFEIVRSSFQDIEIIQYIEDAGTPAESSSWQTYLNHTLVFGYTKEWVEQCIVKLNKAVPKEPEGNPEFNLRISLAKMIQSEMVKNINLNAGPAGHPETDILMEALGLLDIESFSMKIELKDTEMVAENHLHISDLQKGIFTILDVQPSELPTLSFIPQSISSLEVGRFNLLRFWQEIPNVIAVAMPAVQPQFDVILAMVQQQTGIDFEQDLLSHLGTKYIYFSNNEGRQQLSTMVIELKDEAAFKTGLETAISAPAMQSQVSASMDIEEFLHHTLYTIKSQDPASTVAFAVAGGYLLYGQPDALRQVIRTQASETAENQNFEQTELVKGLRQYVSPKAFGYSAIDWKRSMDALIRELAKPQVSSAIQKNWAKSGSALPPPDFSKLPPSDHIASFFNVSYQYVEATPKGLHQKIILKY